MTVPTRTDALLADASTSHASPSHPSTSHTRSTAGQPTTAQLTVSVAALALTFAAGATGVIEASLVDAVVLLAVAVVLPLAIEGGWAWLAAAVAAGVSLQLDPGPVAAALVVPWLAVAASATMRVAGPLIRGRRTVGSRVDLRRHRTPGVIGELADLVATGWAVAAGVAFGASRLGWALLGTGEPIVELTAVHFSYAGCAALVLARRVAAAGSPRTEPVAPGRFWSTLAGAAVVATGVAPLVVATGFVARSPVPQVGGAVLMTIGVWSTATLELRCAGDRRHSTGTRLLFTLSGLAIWVPMVLAVSWAASLYVPVPALSIPGMAETHGVANALGFTLAGLLAWRMAARPRW